MSLRDLARAHLALSQKTVPLGQSLAVSQWDSLTGRDVAGTDGTSGTLGTNGTSGTASNSVQKNRHAQSAGLTDRWCDCGAFASLAWPTVARRDHWRCLECGPAMGRG